MVNSKTRSRVRKTGSRARKTGSRARKTRSRARKTGGSLSSYSKDDEDDDEDDEYDIMMNYIQNIYLKYKNNIPGLHPSVEQVKASKSGRKPVFDGKTRKSGKSPSKWTAEETRSYGKNGTIRYWKPVEP